MRATAPPVLAVDLPYLSTQSFKWMAARRFRYFRIADSIACSSIPPILRCAVSGSQSRRLSFASIRPLCSCGWVVEVERYPNAGVEYGGNPRGPIFHVDVRSGNAKTRSSTLPVATHGFDEFFLFAERSAADADKVQIQFV